MYARISIITIRNLMKCVLTENNQLRSFDEKNKMWKWLQLCVMPMTIQPMHTWQETFTQNRERERKKTPDRQIPIVNIIWIFCQHIDRFSLVKRFRGEKKLCLHFLKNKKFQQIVDIKFLNDKKKFSERSNFFYIKFSFDSSFFFLYFWMLKCVFNSRNWFKYGCYADQFSFSIL